MASTRLYGPSVATASPAAPVAINVQAGKGIVPLPALLVQNTVTAETMVPNPASPTNPLLVQIPSGAELEQKPFELLASGFIKTAGTTNVTVKLYSGTSITPGSNTLLGTSGAIAQNSGTAPWYAKATLIYDSVSGKLTGSIKFFVNGTLVAEVAVSNTITGILNSNNPVASFGVSVTFSAGFAGNEINVIDLAINF